MMTIPGNQRYLGYIKLLLYYFRTNLDLPYPTPLIEVVYTFFIQVRILIECDIMPLHCCNLYVFTWYRNDTIIQENLDCPELIEAFDSARNKNPKKPEKRYFSCLVSVPIINTLLHFRKPHVKLIKSIFSLFDPVFRIRIRIF